MFGDIFVVNQQYIPTYLDNMGYTKHVEDVIVQMYLSGMSSSRIGKEVGMGYNAVLRRLRKCGVEIKPAHGYTKTDTERICKICNIEKPRKAFNDRGWMCTLCKSRKNAHKVRLRKYRLTASQYDNMLEGQYNACAICKAAFGDGKPHIDHCHTTGKVRGLLCSHCNTGLGLFKDSRANLQRAIMYIEHANS